MDLGRFSKAIAALFGGGATSALSTFLPYWLGHQPIGPGVWSVIIAGVVGGILAALAVYQAPANTVTPAQVRDAIREDPAARAVANTETRN
jgi:hypothetical protein